MSNRRTICCIRDVHAITACIFLSTLTCYFERMGFSIAFTKLAESKLPNQEVKGRLLSAFYYGYAVMQVPGGWLAAHYGGSRILGLSFVLWGIFSLITPRVGSDSSNAFLVACRVAIGASQGMFIPASHTLLAQWIPVHERSGLVTLSMSGMYLGSAVAMLYVPYICVHLGAMKQFKISGVLALLWLAMWSRVGSDRPEDGNNLSTSSIHVPTLEEESGVDLFINSKKEDPAPLLSRNSGSTGSNGRGSPTGSSRNKVDTNSVGIGGGGSGGSSVNIPWAVLVKSSAVWAILTSNFAFHYASYVLMNWLPTYFENHLGVPLSDIGSWYSVMPYVMMFLASNVGGCLGTWAHVSRGRSIVHSRKFVNTLGFSLATLSLLLMPRAIHWRDGVLYTTMALSALGLSRGGWAVNHLDVAPRHAGVVMAIANGAGTLAGIVGVSWTGKILDAMGGPSEAVAWSTALGIVALVCATAMVVFLALARGEALFH